jgi:hypothetical protein
MCSHFVGLTCCFRIHGWLMFRPVVVSVRTTVLLSFEFSNWVKQFASLSYMTEPRTYASNFYLTRTYIFLVMRMDFVHTPMGVGVICTIDIYSIGIRALVVDWSFWFPSTVPIYLSRQELLLSFFFRRATCDTSAHPNHARHILSAAPKP